MLLNSKDFSMKSFLIFCFLLLSLSLNSQDDGFYKEIVLDGKYQLRMNKAAESSGEGDYSVYFQLNEYPKTDKPIFVGSKEIFIPKIEQTESGYNIYCSTKKIEAGFVIEVDSNFNYIKYASYDRTTFIKMVLDYRNIDEKKLKSYEKRYKLFGIKQNKFNQFHIFFSPSNPNFNENGALSYYESSLGLVNTKGKSKFTKTKPKEDISAFVNNNPFNLLERENLSQNDYKELILDPSKFDQHKYSIKTMPPQVEVNNLKVAAPQDHIFCYSNYINSFDNQYLIVGYVQKSGDANDFGSTFYNIYMYSYNPDGSINSKFHNILTGHKSVVSQFKYNNDGSLLCSSGYMDVIVWKFLDNKRVIRKKLDNCLFIDWLDNTKVVCYKRTQKAADEKRLDQEYFIYDFETDQIQELTTNTFGTGNAKFKKEHFVSLQSNIDFNSFWDINPNTKKQWTVYKNYVFGDNIINLERNRFSDGESGTLEAKYLASAISVRKIRHKKNTSTKKEINNDAGPSLEQKLAKIKELFEKGLITKEEYDKKRKDIIKNL